MRKLTCTNNECKARVPFEPRQFGERIACPMCRQELLLPAPGAQEPTATELGRPLALPLTATGVVVGIIVLSLAVGGLTATGRVPTYAEGKFIRQAEKKEKGKADETRGTEEAGPPAGQLVALPSGGRRLALLVGVRDYSGPLRPLRFTEADVVEFDRVLKQAGYETTLMTGKDATADNVRARFDSLVGGCGPTDLLVVAFAGHGIEKSGKFFYCPANARPEVPASLVSINDVFDKLAACKAGAKYVFTDACRNDPNPDQRSTLKVESLDDYKAVGGVELQVKPSGNVQAFYSCSPGEYSYEPEAYKHGVFFFYLIRAFQGEGDLDRDGKITFPEVQLYVSKNVASWGLNNRRVQRPNAKGDVNTLTPLAAWTTGSSVEFIGEAALRDDPATLLYENFRNVRAALPAGWNGPGFAVSTDEKTKRPSLQTNKTAGFHSLRLPVRQPRITGDFSIKVEFELGFQAFDTPQVLEVRMLGQQGVVIPVTVNGRGTVSIAGTDPVKREKFSPDKANTLEVVRDGTAYVVRLNGERATATRLEYAGPIEEVWLGVHAARYNTGTPKAKVYEVRVASLPAIDAAGTPDVPTVVAVHERFEQTARSVLPDRWAGADFAVVQDDTHQRPCLQKNRPELGFVELPPVNLPGDFCVDVEYSLSEIEYGRMHTLHLRFEGPPGAADCAIDTLGKLNLAGTAQDKVLRLHPKHNHRLRVIRRDGKYEAYIDDADRPVLQVSYPNFPVNKILLGLAGGSRGAPYHPARVYDVRVTSFGRPVAPAAGWLRQDFVAAKRGDPPPGWAVNDSRLSVGGNDWDGWVELHPQATASNGYTNVPIPAGDFTLTTEVQIPRREDEAVIVGWRVGKKVFIFGMSGTGEYWVTPAKPKNPPKVILPNDRVHEKIELRRVGNAVTVRVNGQQVGTAPADVPAGTFLLSLVRGNAKETSPRVHSLTLTQP